MDACDTLDCSQTLKELDLFLDSELSDAAREAIRHHLDECPDCLSAFDFHAELKQVIQKKCQETRCQPICCRGSRSASTPTSTATALSAEGPIRHDRAVRDTIERWNRLTPSSS